MLLTQKQIDTIGEYHTRGYSNRKIAKELGHSRTTVARHLKAYIGSTDHTESIQHNKDYIDYSLMDALPLLIRVKAEIEVLQRTVSLWKHISIISILGFVGQSLINLFY